MKKTKTTSVDLLPIISKALKPLYAATSITGLIELFAKKKITGKPGDVNECLFAAYAKKALESIEGIEVAFDGSDFDITVGGRILHLPGTDVMEKLTTEFDNSNSHGEKKLAKKYAKLTRKDDDEA